MSTEEFWTGACTRNSPSTGRWRRDRLGWHQSSSMTRSSRNVHGILYNQMRGKSMRGKKWRYFTVDLGVRIPAGNIRCPDAGVDRGVFDSESDGPPVAP